MFYVSEDGSVITLSRGDTGSIRFNVTATYQDTGAAYTFGDDDRAVFSIKNGSGTVIKEQYSPIASGSFLVSFRNSDTDALAAGEYTWDVRYVINPYYDDAGKIVDGDHVITPYLPQRLQLLSGVGDI